MNLRHSAISFVLALVLVTGCNKKSNVTSPPPAPGGTDTSFINPLLSTGPDPWVVKKDSMYYYTHTFGNRIAIFATKKMSLLNFVNPVTVWTPPSSGPYSKDIWAPEIHQIGGKWYAYFAADDGDNKNHRMYVLENPSANPTAGTWTLKGKVSDPTDKWAIDGSVFDYNGQLYFIWSGWEGDVDI